LYKNNPRKNVPQKPFKFFGYSGNYPELLTSALKNRGVWKLIIYDELAEKVQKKRDGKSNYSGIDELIIEKCNFIWRPCNFYEQVQRKIDKRMLKIRYNEENPLIYNHFEQTRQIGTKSGLIRSLR
jgi:hypothetical protein